MSNLIKSKQRHPNCKKLSYILTLTTACSFFAPSLGVAQLVGPDGFSGFLPRQNSRFEQLVTAQPQAGNRPQQTTVAPARNSNTQGNRPQNATALAPTAPLTTSRSCYSGATSMFEIDNEIRRTITNRLNHLLRPITQVIASHGAHAFWNRRSPEAYAVSNIVNEIEESILMTANGRDRLSTEDLFHDIYRPWPGYFSAHLDFSMHHGANHNLRFQIDRVFSLGNPLGLQINSEISWYFLRDQNNNYHVITDFYWSASNLWINLIRNTAVLGTFPRESPMLSGRIRAFHLIRENGGIEEENSSNFLTTIDGISASTYILWLQRERRVPPARTTRGPRCATNSNSP